MDRFNNKFFINQRAFIDPISLIGVGLLVVTLIVGVSVTNNPLQRFLINSQAGFSPGSDVARAERQALRNGGDEWEDSNTGTTCVGAACLAIEHPEYGIENDSGEAIVSTKAKEAMELAQEQSTQYITETVSEEGLRNKSLCLQDGGFWFGDNCSYNQQKDAINEITAIIEKNKTLTVNPPPPPLTTGMVSTPIEETEKGEGLLKQVFDFTPTGKLISAINNPITYNNTVNTPEGVNTLKNVTKTFLDSAMSSYTFNNAWENYIYSFQQPSPTQEQSTSAIQGCIDKGGNAYGCMKQETALTQDQVTSSIDLGIDVTSKIAAVVALPEIAASSSLGALVTSSFSTLGGITALNQTGDTVNTCIEEGSTSVECGKQITYTALTYANLGATDAVMSGVKYAPLLSATVNTANIISDTDTLTANCFGENSNTTGCVISAGALAFDGFGLVVDIKANQLSPTNLANNNSIAYEFYNPADVASYQDYVKAYGAPPKRINIIQNYNDLHPFQTDIINGASPNQMDMGILKDSLSSLKNQNVNIHVLNPQELELRFGKETAGACVLGQCKGLFGVGTKRTADLFITDITGYADIYKTSLSEAGLIAAQKIGHEGGHALDWINLGLGSGNEALWATEFRQKAFNMQFYNAIGETQSAIEYQKFLNEVINNSQVIFNK